MIGLGLLAIAAALVFHTLHSNRRPPDRRSSFQGEETDMLAAEFKDWIENVMKPRVQAATKAAADAARAEGFDAGVASVSDKVTSMGAEVIADNADAVTALNAGLDEVAPAAAPADSGTQQ